MKTFVKKTRKKLSLREKIKEIALSGRPWVSICEVTIIIKITIKANKFRITEWKKVI